MERARREELRRRQEEELRRRLEEERRRKIESNRKSMESCTTQAKRLGSDAAAKWSKLAEYASVMQGDIDSAQATQFTEAVSRLQKAFANADVLAEKDENAARCTQELVKIRADYDRLLRYIQKKQEQFDEIKRRRAREMLAGHQNQQRLKNEQERQLREEIAAMGQRLQEKLDQLTDAFPEAIVQGINGVRRQLENIQENYKKSAEQQLNMLRDLNSHSFLGVLRDVDAWRALSPLRERCAQLCDLLGKPVPAQLSEMAKEDLTALEEELQTKVDTIELGRECAELFKMLNREAPPGIDALQKSQLIALRERLNAAVLEQRSRAYVASAVEETMREMGYSLAASKPGEMEQQHLYTVRGNTMLKVQCQSNGNIAMSIGLGTNDPNHELSIGERAALVDEMAAFCTQYEEIQARLGEKGVRLNRNIVLRPAEARYVQTFDVTEFGLGNAASGSVGKGTARAKKDKQRMYMEKE